MYICRSITFVHNDPCIARYLELFYVPVILSQPNNSEYMLYTFMSMHWYRYTCKYTEHFDIHRIRVVHVVSYMYSIYMYIYTCVGMNPLL